jgi:transketolase
MDFLNYSDELVNDAKNLVKYIRLRTLRMVTSAKSSHIGSCLSAAEITAVIQTIASKSGDVFIFSKGHAAATLYATLAGLKLIPEELLENFGKDGSELTGHVNQAVPTVSYSSGSLGHGLPFGVGVAIGSKHKKVYVLISDGELNEGTTWESLAIANHLGLGNLILVADTNGIQSFGNTKDILDLKPLKAKIESFGWECCEIDGHSIPDLYNSLTSTSLNKPRAIIARTIKGKGVKSMENKLEWHYKSPSSENLQTYLDEVDNNA